MLGFIVMAILAALDASSPGGATSLPSISGGVAPTIDVGIAGGTGPTNLAALKSQFSASQFVGGTYNSQVVNNPVVQAQREQAQGAAIQQQVTSQIASGKTNVTSNSPTATPIQIRAPSGSTKSFL